MSPFEHFFIPGTTGNCGRNFKLIHLIREHVAYGSRAAELTFNHSQRPWYLAWFTVEIRGRRRPETIHLFLILFAKEMRM